MREDIDRVLLTEEQIQKRVSELGAEIPGLRRQGRCRLHPWGALCFMADLSRNITIPVDMDFMAISSYGASTKSSASGSCRSNALITTATC